MNLAWGELQIFSVLKRLEIVRSDYSALDEESIATQHLPFRRKVISDVFGGQQFQVYVRPGKNRQIIEGNDAMIFYNPDWNPAAPLTPGSHGLLFGVHVDSSWLATPSIAVFRGLLPDYQYMGQYTLHDSDPFTYEEWVDLTPTVGSHFASLLSHSEPFPVKGRLITWNQYRCSLQDRSGEHSQVSREIQWWRHLRRAW